MVMGLFLASILGCSVDFENRSLPDPDFYGEDVFGKSVILATLEDTVEDPFSSLGVVNTQPAVETQDLKNVSLAGMVKSALPNDMMGGGWSEATTDHEFLLVHEQETKTGVVPSVIIYGYYDPSASQNPPLASRRFFSTVDPGFEQTGLWQLSSFISSVVSTLSVEQPLSPADFQAVVSVFQPTLGIGFGYESFPESFTGWKWVGQNKHGVLLSLGKTQGKFVQVKDSLQDSIRKLQLQSPEELLQDIAGLKSVQQEVSKVSGIPSEMVLGTLRYQKQTVYLSIMCLTQPTCLQKDVLIDFLNKLSPIGPNDILSSSLYSSTTELGQKYNLPLFQSSLDSFMNMDTVVTDELMKFGDQSMESIFSGSLNSVISEGTDIIDDLSEGAVNNVIDGAVGEPQEPEGNENAEGDSGY